MKNTHNLEQYTETMEFWDEIYEKICEIVRKWDYSSFEEEERQVMKYLNEFLEWWIHNAHYIKLLNAHSVYFDLHHHWENNRQCIIDKYSKQIVNTL